MALSGDLARFTYSGATNPALTQGDPLLSLGHFNVDSTPASRIPLSAPYAQASLNGVSPAINQLSASTPDSGETRTPAVGDWVTVVTGLAAPAFGKIDSIASGVLTLDRELPALTAASDSIRTSKAENVFPNVTLAQASAGLTDHRMLYFFQNGGGTEGGFRFWIVPLTANAATIEIMAATDPFTSFNAPEIPDGETSPFNQFGSIDFTLPTPVFTLAWDFSEITQARYSQQTSTPLNGIDTATANSHTAIWLRRVIPPNATGGKCVFALLTASTADPTPNPDPFVTGFIFEFEIPESTYSATIVIDRIAYTGGAARVTTTIVDGFGVPVSGLNAWVEIQSGPGSIDTDLDGTTDSNGQLFSVYTSPLVVSVDAVLRVVIPTNPEV